MKQEQQPSASVVWSSSVQEGPDGKPWVGLSIGTPFAQYVVGMDIDSAEKLVQDLPDLLKGAIVEAKRRRSGLFVANQGTVSLLKGKKA